MNTMEWPDFQYSPFDEECLQALLEDDAVAGAGHYKNISFIDIILSHIFYIVSDNLVIIFDIISTYECH